MASAAAFGSPPGPFPTVSYQGNNGGARRLLIDWGSLRRSHTSRVRRRSGSSPGRPIPTRMAARKPRDYAGRAGRVGLELHREPILTDCLLNLPTSGDELTATNWNAESVPAATTAVGQRIVSSTDDPTKEEYVNTTIAASIVAIISALALLTGCGSSSESSTSPVVKSETVTVTETVEAAAEQQPAAAEPATPPPPAAVQGSIEVPKVVGMDHQLAQDTMQAAGLYSLSEEDATGQGRSLLWDRNWTVVSQSPSPGSQVSEDQTIVLRSKKDDE